MPQKPNKLLRIVVPILLGVAGILIGVAVLVNSSRPPGTPSGASSPTTAGSQAAAPAQGTTGAAGEAPAATTPITEPAEPAAAQPSEPAPSAPTVTGGPAPAYTARLEPVATPYAPMGSLEPDSGFEMEVKFSAYGAGIESLTLTNEYTTIYKTEQQQLQARHPNVAAPATGVTPFAVAGVEVDGVMVVLGSGHGPDQSYWVETGPGAFEATILNGSGAPALRVTRRYELEKGSHDLVVRQGVENLGSAPVLVRWFQFGPVDLPRGTQRIMGDYRRVRFGYLNSPAIDPSRQIVDASRFLIERSTALGKATVDEMTGLRNWPGRKLWPNPDSTNKQLTPVWAGMTNRHYCVVLHALVDPGASQPDKALNLAGTVHSFVLPGYEKDGRDATVSLALESETMTVGAGSKLDLSTGIYAGPHSRKFMTEPRTSVVGLARIVMYTMGGPCAFCTFPSVTNLLYWGLTRLHDYVLFDYALAIMVLVVVVRGILHPITKRAQISMQRFSKQMQALAPKQKKIQEKYGNDPQKMREEIAKLMREEHISYGSAAKGCITPFLQTPVWIALYAMLYFMYELRHTPGFFGVFQWISQSAFGVKWAFLADLSEPDHFIPFGGSFRIPLLSDLFLGSIDGLNLLPLLLGVVFYIQQKYLMPPPAATMTPEQQTQQRITKIMMVVMFPLLMYNQPAALTLYFVVNSTLGILESRYIRQHAEKHGLLEVQVKPRKGDAPRKPGFFARLQAMAEEKQRELERRQKEAAKRGKK